MNSKKDTQGQYGRAIISQEVGEHFMVSLTKKTERLATALYLVTSFLSDNEPLKPRLRCLALELVQKTGTVRYGSGAVEKNVFDEMQGFIAETLALLELAFIAGLVSEMNFTILKREYALLRDATEVKKVSRESRSDTILGDTFFGSSFTDRAQKKNLPTDAFSLAHNRISLPTSGALTEGEISLGHSKGQKDISVSHRMTNTEPRMASTNAKVSTSIQDGAQKVTSKTSTSTSSAVAVDVVKDARRARIIKLIKDNREVAIKDIANHFPELSEKTIQRELVSLTESGVLKKFGERRWSRYALA